MTNLSKPVRRTLRADSGVRDLIVSLEPPGLLTFREKGTRKSYALGLRALFIRAVSADVEAERKTRRRRRSK